MTQLLNGIEQIRAEPAAYVVGPSDVGYLYKGSARNLRERLKDHRAGRVSRTKNHRPLALFFHRYFNTYTEARAFENYLKTGVGREWLSQQIGQTVPPRADPP
jgi:predicted GIY-YIG superfamily endonuclease